MVVEEEDALLLAEPSSGWSVDCRVLLVDVGVGVATAAAAAVLVVLARCCNWFLRRGNKNREGMAGRRDLEQ